MNYLSLLPSSAHFDEITSLHKTRQEWVNQNKKGFLRYRTPYKHLQKFTARHIDCSTHCVTIGQPDEISPSEQKEIKDSLKSFMPWRKGPFSVFGIDIDAEWRSERKWQRIIPILPDLKGKIIADIGCNNGYYMFDELEPGNYKLYFETEYLKSVYAVSAYWPPPNIMDLKFGIFIEL